MSSSNFGLVRSFKKKGDEFYTSYRNQDFFSENTSRFFFMECAYLHWTKHEKVADVVLLAAWSQFMSYFEPYLW